MSNQQIRDALEAGKNFIDGNWEEDHLNEHDWKEELPYGYSSDGVRIRYCEDCGISIVFNLDNQKDGHIEGAQHYIKNPDELRLCGEPPQLRPFIASVTAEFALDITARTEEEVEEVLERMFMDTNLSVDTKPLGTEEVYPDFGRYTPATIDIEVWEG